MIRVLQILFLSSLLIVAGCSSKHKNSADANSINSANSAFSSPKTSGLGEDGNLDEISNEANASKRTFYFDFDSNVIHESDKAAIDANADRLLINPDQKIIIEGHTDPRGSREYNIGLGERRAKAIADALTASGVNPTQIRIVSYGAQKLATMGHTEQDYQLDRRAIIVYLR